MNKSNGGRGQLHPETAKVEVLVRLDDWLREGADLRRYIASYWPADSTSGKAKTPAVATR